MWNDDVDILEDLNFRAGGVNEIDVAKFEDSVDFFGTFAVGRVNIDFWHTVDSLVDFGAGAQGEGKRLEIRRNFCNREGTDEDCEENADVNEINMGVRYDNAAVGDCSYRNEFRSIPKRQCLRLM